MTNNQIFFIVMCVILLVISIASVKDKITFDRWDVFCYSLLLGVILCGLMLSFLN